MSELKPSSLESLVCKYQCPGCLRGSSTDCGSYEPDQEGLHCENHVLGTMMMPTGFIALGFPKGFCRPGYKPDGSPISTMNIRLWSRGKSPDFDHLNVPVWAMEYQGALFVRTAIPRLAVWITDVIEGGTLELVPNALDVATFYDEID